MTDTVALGLSGLGILMTMLAAAGAAARHSQAVEQEQSWGQRARRHLPYQTMSDEELDRVRSREELGRAIIVSAERQYGAKPGSLTRNALEETLVKDISRRAEDIYAPEEIKDIAGTAYTRILADWNRLARQKRAGES